MSRRHRVHTARETHWFFENQGNLFKKKQGRVPHKVVDINYDYSYAADYNFVNVAIKLENQNTKRSVWRPFPEVYHEWEKVNEDIQVPSSSGVETSSDDAAGSEAS